MLTVISALRDVDRSVRGHMKGKSVPLREIVLVIFPSTVMRKLQKRKTPESQLY
jgi:hypothetical protein